MPFTQLVFKALHTVPFLACFRDFYIWMIIISFLLKSL
nr:MAG TPA: hypothetical protein [Caudoviricetes sp.]